TASAVLGATTFLVGGAVMPLAGIGDILVSTAVVMSACALLVGGIFLKIDSYR
ncbi:MAG: Bcr/CflA family drug resistance efflux transporter, partial [Candidatus Symbiothrix sp.]|nr:Bcr/CflA family drug resistance efflux transporter [Candidatus Symbiothrix sp.]